MWSGHSPSRRTRRIQRIRGSRGGLLGAETWGAEVRRLEKHKHEVSHRFRGHGTWGSETAQLHRLELQRQRRDRRGRSWWRKLLGQPPDGYW